MILVPSKLSECSVCSLWARREGALTSAAGKPSVPAGWSPRSSVDEGVKRRSVDEGVPSSKPEKEVLEDSDGGEFYLCVFEEVR